IRDRRYLLCPSEVTVHHLKKFIRIKFHLSDSYKIEMYRAREELSDDLMLQDIALIYSWRGDRPMNLCYTITEPPKTKSGQFFKKTQLVNKQSDVCHIHAASPADKESHPESKLSNLTMCSSEDDLSSLAISTSDVVLTPTSDTNASKSTSSSPVSEVMTPLSAELPVTGASLSSRSAVPCNDATRTTTPSACINASSTLSNNKLSEAAVHPHEVSSATSLQPPPFGSYVSKQPEPTLVLGSSTNNKSQSKPGTAKQEISKLMHSVESILSKTPKTNHRKSKNKTLTWTPACEVLAASSNLCKDKNGKTASKNVKYKLEVNLSELPKCSVASDSHTSKNVDHLILGFKRSQSVIETSGAVVEGQGQKSQEVVSNSQPLSGDALCQTEATTDIFFSYIPKFQKHRKLYAVKRSVSYEGPSEMPVLAVATSDAMEKRNWKKRKLSTLDFDSSKVTAVESCSPTSDNVVSAVEVDSVSYNRHSSEDTTNRSGPAIAVPPDNAKNSPQLTSHNSVVSTSASYKIPSADTSMPVLLPQENPIVGFQEKPQSDNCLLDPKVKISRKSNHTPCTNSTSTNKSSRTSHDQKTSDSSHVSKVSKSKKQSRVVDSDGESSKAYINKKSLGYIMNKSVSNNCVNGSVNENAQRSSSSKSVEEISVDICSSPVEVSVTYPTPYVTSPGTEDRTDNLTLPEIQTQCVNSCVVNFPAKIVPLDLSSRKKK
ncbi:unnamed protein product, partial [Candidula unifasciata]